MIFLIIAVVVLVLAALWAMGAYNGLVKLRNLVEEAWSQIEVELKRRHDLIPNLVETVKGYASHERETLDAVVKARAAAAGATGSVANQAAAEGMLNQALGRLFAVAEAYPDLKANVNFQELQRELTSTEDRIAAGRRFYNANVRELNTKIETFPTNLLAGPFGFVKKEYFEVDSEVERQAPHVSFGSSDTPGTAS